MTFTECRRSKCISSNRPESVPPGRGEAQGPPGAAIWNRVAHATGGGIRDLPYTPTRCLAALGEDNVPRGMILNAKGFFMTIRLASSTVLRVPGQRWAQQWADQADSLFGNFRPVGGTDFIGTRRRQKLTMEVMQKGLVDNLRPGGTLGRDRVQSRRPTDYTFTVIAGSYSVKRASKAAFDTVNDHHRVIQFSQGPCDLVCIPLRRSTSRS